MVGPCADAVDRLNHAEMGYIAATAGEKIFAGRVAGCGRVGREREVTGKTGLEQAFDAVQVFQNELVACVKLDAGFAVDAFCVELCAKPALWPGSITSRLA